MNKLKQNLLLADDDADDCDFFKEALEELSLDVTLSIVNDGVEVMDFLLSHVDKLPCVLFLDLNMPRKSGLECLREIKLNEQLKDLPVIIFSTSSDMVDATYENGAHYYIRKPAEFSQLKKVILNAIVIITGNITRPAKENFILKP